MAKPLMTEQHKKMLFEVLLTLAVIFIIWLLLRKTPLVYSSPTQQAPQTALTPVNLEPAGYVGSVYNIGGLTTDPINYTILFGPSTSQGESCSCGCDPNSALNSSLQGLATFINQYQNGLAAAQSGIINALSDAVPNWMSQYINAGGGAIGYVGGAGGI